MKNSGTSRSARIGLLLTALAIGAAACGSTPSEATASLPAGCHRGVAHDLESTLAILTDPADCAGSVNAYWTSQLGKKWTQPVFVPYRDGQVPHDRCGMASGNPDEFADNAFYCPADDTVAFSRDLLKSLYVRGGPYLPVVVLMHELGHRADHIADVVGPISRSEENQADCSAGVTTAYARAANRLPFTDVIRAATEQYKIGDTRHFGSELASSPNAHGTPAQRVIAFGRGYFQKISACRSLGQSPTGNVA